MNQNTMITGSICLTDLPEGSVKIGANGKAYLNFAAVARKEVSQYGEDVNFIVNRTKEEREAGKAVQYIGNGKTIVFNGKPEDMKTASMEDVAKLGYNGQQAPPAETAPPAAEPQKDNLPF